MKYDPEFRRIAVAAIVEAGYRQILKDAEFFILLGNAACDAGDDDAIDDWYGAYLALRHDTRFSRAMERLCEPRESTAHDKNLAVLRELQAAFDRGSPPTELPKLIEPTGDIRVYPTKIERTHPFSLHDVRYQAWRRKQATASDTPDKP